MDPSQLIPEHFCYPKRKPFPIIHHSLLLPPALGNHQSTFCLWIALFWTFPANGPVSVSGFFLRNVFLNLSMIKRVLRHCFLCLVTSVCGCTTFVYQVIHQWTLNCSHLLVVVNSVAANTHGHVLTRICAFHSLGISFFVTEFSGSHLLLSFLRSVNKNVNLKLLH